jgi:(p)ppGpp synthase/HD superfamily hydrolase
MTTNKYIEKYGFDPFRYSQIIKIAIKLATNGHNDTNHKYGDASYTIHLSHAVDVGLRFLHLLPIQLRPLVVAALWLHDSIEDARLSYNDIVKAFTKGGVSHEDAIAIAEIVRAVTNYGRGRNRDERMPDFVYEDIRNTPGARFAKCCDRIANIEFGGKTSMYREEHAKFAKELFHDDLVDMFDYMEIFYAPRMLHP